MMLIGHPKNGHLLVVITSALFFAEFSTNGSKNERLNYS